MVLPTFDQSVRCEILGLPGTESLRDLLELESREFEAVLGQPMEFAPPSQRKRNVWQVNVQPGISASSLHAETENLRLISRVRRPADFAETLQLLHSLAHSPHLPPNIQNAGHMQKWPRGSHPRLRTPTRTLLSVVSHGTASVLATPTWVRFAVARSGTWLNAGWRNLATPILPCVPQGA